MQSKKGFSKNWSIKMRTLHRYTGFFMIGIILVYAFSGTVLLFRDTYVFKTSEPAALQLPQGLTQSELIREVSQHQELNLRHFSITGEKDQIISFAKNRYNTAGTYNRKTGLIQYTQKE